MLTDKFDNNSLAINISWEQQIPGASHFAVQVTVVELP